MGFLERLRREKESQERAREEQERRERERREHDAMLAEQRRQQAERVRQYHEERHRQAQQFWDESGVGSLLDEFRRLIPAQTQSEGEYGYRYDFKERDQDSVYGKVGWYKRWLRDDYLVIEVCSNGTVQFHGDLFGSSTIPLDRWRNNKQLLESALERAYHHPRIRYYKKAQSTPHWESRSDGGGRG